MIVNIHEAKTRLSRLIDRATSGEEIIIAKAGKPMARLVPFEKAPPERKLGSWKGGVWIAPDFDELPSDILDAFNEGEEF